MIPPDLLRTLKHAKTMGRKAAQRKVIAEKLIEKCQKGPVRVRLPESVFNG